MPSAIYTFTNWTIVSALLRVNSVIASQLMLFRFISIFTSDVVKRWLYYQIVGDEFKESIPYEWQNEQNYRTY
jgi:hypothetical protein